MDFIRLYFKHHISNIMPDDSKSWDLLSSEILFEHPFIKLSEDRVVLPSGKESTWLCLDFGGDGACVILENSEGKILLGRQYCHPPRALVFEFPGGGVGKNETPEAAARREAIEEVGVYPKNLTNIGYFLFNNRRSSAKLYVFVGKDLELREAAPEEHEQVEIAWYSVEEIDEMIRLGQIVNVNLLGAWALYKSRKY